MAGKETLISTFQQDYYLFRRKVFRLFGGAFHVYDEQSNLLLFSEQKAFKLREDMRVYADETKAQELLVIRTPQILDFAATYHVRDGISGLAVGAIRRKGLRSLVRDEWVLLGPDGSEVGRLREASLGGALLSRFIELVPQKYEILSSADQVVARVRQHFDPFVLKYSLTISQPEPEIDRRLLVAMGVLLAAIERRQE